MADSNPPTRPPSARLSIRSRSRSRPSTPKLERLYSGQHLDDVSMYHEHSGNQPAADEPASPPLEPTESSDPPSSDFEKEEEEDVIPEVRDGIEDEHDVEKGMQQLSRAPSTRSRKDPNTVTWDGPDDPNNPKNWSMGRKWAATVIVSCFTFISPVSSSMVAPALQAMGKDLNATSEVEKQLMLSIFVLAYAIGPLFLGPLSEIYGRVPVLQLANLFYFAFNTACGFATNTPQMLAFRFLSGLGGSAPLAIGGGVLSDCWQPEQRGKAISIYSLAPLLGPAVGPIAGAFITENTTWRWAFWATSVADICVQVAGLFFLQETYAPKLLHQKMLRLQKETGNELLRTESRIAELTILMKLRVSLVRPFIMLGTQPIIQVLAVYMAYVYGLVYLVLSTFPTLWTTVYHESLGIGGLNFISLGIGFFLGAQVTAPFNDRTYRRLKAKHNGVGRPEFRCPVMIPGAALVPVGLFWYGWSAQARLHWIMPNIGAALFAAGTIICFQCTQTYIVDAYSRYAASGVAAATVLRSLAGFGFPLFAPAMYGALDYGWGNSVLGFAALALGIPAPFLLWKYGEKLRAKSRYAAGA